MNQEKLQSGKNNQTDKYSNFSSVSLISRIVYLKPKGKSSGNHYITKTFAH